MHDPAGSPSEADDVLAVVPLRCHGIAASPESLRTLRHALTAWVLAAGLSADRAQDIALASYEALANVADHAYAGDGTGTVDLDATLLPDRVQVIITDRGRWRTPVPDPRPLSLRGRGLLLLHASADHADIQADAEGTVVTLTWDLDPVS